jgi:hypothetical protein
MKTTFLKIAGLAIALAAFGAVHNIGIHAQQTTGKSNHSPATTNWVGCLVVGQKNSFDQMTSDPYPTTVRRVEIGLRSDGIVVWQEATKAK